MTKKEFIYLYKCDFNKNETMKKEEFSYDKAMADLEKIVQKIESGECKIDELTAEVKKAVDLIALCRKKLQDVDNDVNKALGEIDG